MTQKRLFSFVLAIVLGFTAMLTTTAMPAFAENGTPAPVAKVGNTEYTTIDEAIENWTNNSTLTLLDNVTLNDVITIKSTEHHTLDLGTYTMTAASGKNAIEIKAYGTGSAERNALTVNADANNPGEINAGSKSCVYYKYATTYTTGEDRPIITINGGVFTSTASGLSAGIYGYGSAARKCATLTIKGGTFDCTINLSNKGKLLIAGGTFNKSVGCQGDSTAYRLISGGKFKTIGFMTTENNSGTPSIAFGSKMNVYDTFLYVDNDGYLNVVNAQPVDIEFGAKVNYSAFSSYLKYSSAKDGLYYQSLELGLEKGSNIVCYSQLDGNTYQVPSTKTFDLTIEGSILPMREVVLTASNSKFTYTCYEGAEPDVTVTSASPAYEVVETVTSALAEETNKLTYTYSLNKLPTYAKIASTEYPSLLSAVNNAQSGDVITLLDNVVENGFILDKDLTIDLGGYTYTIEGTVGSVGTETNGLQLLKDVNVTIKNGTITSETAKMLVQNYANLTLENVILDGTNLAGNVPYTLSNNSGNVSIKNSTIIGSSNGFAFDVCDYASYTAPIITVENSTITGKIEMTDTNDGEFAGKIIDGNNTYTEVGNYLQIIDSILPIFDYNLSLNVSNNAIKANDEITVDVVIDKAYYSLDYTFNYDNTKFSCAEDTDNDGIIEINCLTTGNAGVLATYTLTALNDITKFTTTEISVNGNVVQHAILSLTNVENVVNGDIEQVNISLDYLAEIKIDYVTGYTLVLIKGEDAGYAYDGQKMIYVTEYNAFAILVEGTVDLEQMDALLAKTTDCKVIVKSYDVNAEYVIDGVIDLKDATVAYACYNLDFDVNEYLELFLKADVNNDYCVNYSDVNAITANYTK